MPDTAVHLITVHSGKTYGYMGGAHPKAGAGGGTRTHELFTYGIFLKILPGRPQLTTGECMDEKVHSIHMPCWERGLAQDGSW